MRQEELYWEAKDREKLRVTGGWVHTGRKKTMTKNLTTRCLKEIKISPGAGSVLKARLALLTPRPKQQAFFKAETYSNMLMQRGFKAFIDSTQQLWLSWTSACLRWTLRRLISSSDQGYCPSVQGHAGHELGAAEGRFSLNSVALNEEFCNCPYLLYPQGADLSQTHTD